jgi:hypothetical protein
MKVFTNQRIAMRFLAQDISNNICLARMIMYLQIVVLDQLQPLALMHVQLRLSKNVLETFMISIDVAHVTKQVMSPNLQSMNNCS